MGEWTEKALAMVESGRKAWEDGADMPPMPEGEEVNAGALFWVGFMEARSRDFFKRRGMALYPETVEPRPATPEGP